MGTRLVLTLALLYSFTASADPAEPIDAAALDVDGRPVVGLDLRFGRSDDGDSSVTMFLFELQGRLPIAQQFLLHARLPFEASRVDTPFGDEGTSSLGNLQLGGRWAKQVRQVRVGLGGNLGLPTAADDGEPAFGGLLASGFITPIDLSRYLPNTTRLGFDASLRWSDGRFFVHGELALDFLLIDDADDNQVFYLRILAGAQVTPELTVMAGLHNAFLLDAPLGADDTTNALAFGGILALGRIDLGFQVYLPLDDFADPWGLGASVAARF